MQSKLERNRHTQRYRRKEGQHIRHQEKRTQNQNDTSQVSRRLPGCATAGVVERLRFAGLPDSDGFDCFAMPRKAVETALSRMALDNVVKPGAIGEPRIMISDGIVT